MPVHLITAIKLTVSKYIVAAKYGKSCPNAPDVFWRMDTAHEDGIQPTYFEGIRQIDVDADSWVYYNRPKLSNVNFETCGDMECDGFKKVLVMDKDGSLFGSPTTIVPQSEWQWDQDRAYGIGSSRVPRRMTTLPNGTTFPLDTKWPLKGVIRDDTCKLVSNIQAYKCNSTLDHRVLLIESLDEDRLLRRIAPVAFATEGLQGQLVLNAPTFAGQYLPDPAANLSGTNYFDETTQLFYVVIKGSSVVELRLQPVIKVSFGLPAMTEAEFFGSNVLDNLASFLGIPKSRIRVAKVVSERSSGSRRRRAATGIQVVLEISEPPSNTTNTSSTPATVLDAPTATQPTAMEIVATTLVNSVQTNMLSSALQVPVSSVQVLQPPPQPGSDRWSALTSGTDSLSTQPETIQIPTTAETAVNATVVEGEPFTIVLSTKDAAITAPNSTVVLRRDLSFDVGMRLFNVTATSIGTADRVNATTGNNTKVPMFRIQMHDRSTGRLSERLDWRNFSWKLVAGLCSDVNSQSNTTGSIVSPTLADYYWNGSLPSGTASYTFCFGLRAYDSNNASNLLPAYTPALVSVPLQVTGDVTPTAYSKTVRITFAGTLASIASKLDKFKDAVKTKILSLYAGVNVTSVALSDGSILADVTMTSNTDSSLAAAQTAIENSVSAGTMTVTVDGVNYSAPKKGFQFKDQIHHGSIMDQVGLSDIHHRKC
ncbi:unnamed protein product [Echinostoma caproni]|uniref:LysM domain-containing protein n=1 Tax=Echinostoma caproni TaxID=27848 RepID=A0A183ACK8_9TREM|nr:unnamed protein product [Echinostoma caproni]